MNYHRFSIIQGRAVMDKRVSDSQLRTLSALGMYADKDGWCWPSQTTLAEDVGKTRQTVNEHLSRLIEYGYIESKQRHGGNGEQLSNMYRLLYDPEFTGGVSNLDFTPGVSPRLDTNDPLNDSLNTMAKKKNLLCRNCKSPIFYDESTVYIHDRKRGREDNGYYCVGEGYLGKHAEPLELPIEWQIASGSEALTLPDQKQAGYKDAANIISMGFGANQQLAYEIAYAFMNERGIQIPQGKLKGQRKAIKEMIEMGVNATHVIDAVKQLIDKDMTVTDLFSVSKTAVALANPAKIASKFEGL